MVMPYIHYAKSHDTYTIDKLIYKTKAFRVFS